MLSSLFCLCNIKLLSNDSVHGAVGGAGAAINTNISVDLVLGIALSDSINGAVLSASAAANASVSNLVSHNRYLQVIKYTHPL